MSLRQKVRFWNLIGPFIVLSTAFLLTFSKNSYTSQISLFHLILYAASFGCALVIAFLSYAEAESLTLKINQLEIDQIKQKTEITTDELIKAMNRIAELQQESKLHFSTQKQFLAKMKSLKEEKEEQQFFLNVAKNEVRALTEKNLSLFQEKELIHLDAVHAERLLRKSEGLRHQLQQQFEEKSDTLHKTRQELFRLHEKLSALEIDQQEQNLEKTHQELKEIRGLLLQIDREF